METHQHAALLRDIMNREAGAGTVAPRGADHRWQEALRGNLSQPREVVFEHALLGGDLRRSLHVLHRTAAAETEIRATGRDPLCALAQHLRRSAKVEVAAAAPARECHALAGESALDEGDLALYVCDSDTVLVDRLDEGFGHRITMCIEWSAFQIPGAGSTS